MTIKNITSYTKSCVTVKRKKKDVRAVHKSWPCVGQKLRKKKVILGVLAFSFARSSEEWEARSYTIRYIRLVNTSRTREGLTQRVRKKVEKMQEIGARAGYKYDPGEKLRKASASLVWSTPVGLSSNGYETGCVLRSPSAGCKLDPPPRDTCCILYIENRRIPPTLLPFPSGSTSPKKDRYKMSNWKFHELRAISKFRIL